MSDLSDFGSDDDNTDFHDAADLVAKNTNRIDQTTLLELYGFYKQATIGRCNISKPGIFNMQARSKWNAWNDLKDMSKEDAKTHYVSRVKSLAIAQANSDDGAGVGSWVSVSVMQPEKDTLPESDKTIFDFVQENNMERLDQILPTLSRDELNRLDTSGMGLLHWAADRGNTEVLQKLLSQPDINVNIQDVDLQTPIHYASSCGHLVCVQLLLAAGADKSMQDVDSKTSLELAFNEDIRNVLQH
jgi:acyl-CoA-binding protein